VKLEVKKIILKNKISNSLRNFKIGDICQFHGQMTTTMKIVAYPDHQWIKCKILSCTEKSKFNIGESHFILSKNIRKVEPYAV